MDENILQQIREKKEVFGIPEDEFLFSTIVGSHMWNMEHEGSDIDLFIVRRASTKDVLIGKDIGKTVRGTIEIDGIKVEYDIHEVGKVVKMLIKNNPNFIWGATSPIFVDGSRTIHDDMRQLANLLMSKEIYKPIRGMVRHNTNKYIFLDRDSSEKRCNTIARTVFFGIDVLIHKSFRYESVDGFTPDDIMFYILDYLDDAFQNSTLPEKPLDTSIQSTEVWLYKTRLEILRI